MRVGRESSFPLGCLVGRFFFRGQTGFCRFREYNLSEKLTHFLQSCVPKRGFFLLLLPESWWKMVQLKMGIFFESSNDSIGDTVRPIFPPKKTRKKNPWIFFGKKLGGPHLFQQLWDAPTDGCHALRVWCQMVKSSYLPWKSWPPNVHLAAWMSDGWMGSGGWGEACTLVFVY